MGKLPPRRGGLEEMPIDPVPEAGPFQAFGQVPKRFNAEIHKLGVDLPRCTVTSLAENVLSLVSLKIHQVMDVMFFQVTLRHPVVRVPSAPIGLEIVSSFGLSKAHVVHQYQHCLFAIFCQDTSPQILNFTSLFINLPEIIASAERFLMYSLDQKIKNWYRDETGDMLSDENVNEVTRNLRSLGLYMLMWHVSREVGEPCLKSPNFAYQSMLGDQVGKK
jgi:hypothetical protein